MDAQRDAVRDAELLRDERVVEVGVEEAAAGHVTLVKLLELPALVIS